MSSGILIVALALVMAAVLGAARVARRKSVDRIVRDRLTRRRPPVAGPRHVFLSVVDHFEPFWHNRDPVLAAERVRRWRTRYPEIARRFRDAGGRPPRHAFFYPQEEYPMSPACMDPLAELHALGLADVEVHLHHDHDSADALREKLLQFTGMLRDRHGLLHDDPATGRPVYAFIHGNWVLGNSGPGGEFCGVDDEFVVLHETGCYADFTFPSAPHPSQPPRANTLYYPAGDLRRPRAHFRARDACYGTPAPPDAPLLVTGPLALNWRRRKRGILPSLENADLTATSPPGPDRLDLWIRTAVSVRNFPRWIFVKLHTHGAQEANAELLLGDGAGSLASLFGDALARYNDGARHVLHFATPWEIVRAVHVLESADNASIRAIENFEYPF